MLQIGLNKFGQGYKRDPVKLYRAHFLTCYVHIMARRRLSTDSRWQIIGSHRAGLSTRQIAREFNINQSQVSRLLQRWRQTGGVDDRQRSGRPRLTSARQDRALLRTARQNRFLSARQLRDIWGRHVSRRTTNRRLVAGGLRARRPRRKPVLLPRHKRNRLAWETYRQTWNIRMLSSTSSDSTPL